MTNCTCPSDGRTIDKAERVYVYEPTADVQIMTPHGPQRQLDASKVHIFHKDCPVHGYKVIGEK